MMVKVSGKNKYWAHTSFYLKALCRRRFSGTLKKKIFIFFILKTYLTIFLSYFNFIS